MARLLNEALYADDSGCSRHSHRGPIPAAAADGAGAMMMDSGSTAAGDGDREGEGEGGMKEAPPAPAPACQHSSHFCFASESCVPIVPLDAALKEIGIFLPPPPPPPSPLDIGTGTAERDVDAGLPSSPPAAAAAAAASASASVPVLAPCKQQSWLNYDSRATNGYAQQLQFAPLTGVIPQV